MEHIFLSNAASLPDGWDAAAGSNIFLKRDQLMRIESVNPCGQEYHMFFAGDIDSIAVIYRLKLDILTYSRLSLKLPVTILGIPCSVSKCGYKIGEKTKEKVSEFLNTLQGTRLILNAGHDLDMNNFTRGTTLPTCRLPIRWESFEAYLSSMRSHYRYRVRKALGKGEEVIVTELKHVSLFDEALYRLYLQVYQKSEYKLEKLGIDFFRIFPARILKFEVHGKPVAFIQLLENGDELVFLFGGLDYSQNLKYDIYLNMLLEIIKWGIAGGYKEIDLGQTAEDTKLKLGCRLCGKYLYASHSNALINRLVDRGIGFLSYRTKAGTFDVFKGEGT